MNPRSRIKSSVKDDGRAIEEQLVEIFEVEMVEEDVDDLDNSRDASNSNKSRAKSRKSKAAARSRKTIGPTQWCSIQKGGKAKKCRSPEETVPPKGYKWSGDWKIDISKGTDSFGWKKVESPSLMRIAPSSLKPASFPRQRRWLRIVKKEKKTRLDGPATPLGEIKADQAASEQGEDEADEQKKQINTVVSKALAGVADDWNWKGYGWSFYKSFLFPLAGGVAFRIPLSQNFLSYFNKPYLPAINSSLGFYYPWTLGVFLSFR